MLCLQETKIQASHVPELDAYMKNTFGAHRIFWSCSRARKGYSGTAVLLFNNSEEHTKEDNHRTTFTINEVEGDVEGRTITLETDKFSLVNAYVPNSGAELAKLPYRVSTWDVKLAEHINELKARRPHVPVILTGDLNVAYGALDYHNPLESRTKLQAGTTPEEQASFRALLLQQCGLVDTFRAQYPEQRRYSYFSARLGDRGRRDKLGMRLDYVLAAMPQGTASATAQCGIRGVDVEAELAGGSAASGRGAVSILSGSITSTVASASMFAHHKADVLVQGATQPQPLSALNYDAYIEDEVLYAVTFRCNMICD